MVVWEAKLLQCPCHLLLSSEFFGPGTWIGKVHYTWSPFLRDQQGLRLHAPGCQPSMHHSHGWLEMFIFNFLLSCGGHVISRFWCFNADRFCLFVSLCLVNNILIVRVFQFAVTEEIMCNDVEPVPICFLYCLVKLQQRKLIFSNKHEEFIEPIGPILFKTAPGLNVKYDNF